MPHSVAGAGLPSFPRLCGGHWDPPITCMSILICPDVHCSPFPSVNIWQGKLYFPSSFGKRSAAEGGQLQSIEARVAAPKPRCLQDW